MSDEYAPEEIPVIGALFEGLAEQFAEMATTLFNVIESMLDMLDTLPTRRRAWYDATDKPWEADRWRVLVMAHKYPKRKRARMRAQLEEVKHIQFYSKMNREWKRDNERHTATGSDEHRG